MKEENIVGPRSQGPCAPAQDPRHLFLHRCRFTPWWAKASRLSHTVLDSAPPRCSSPSRAVAPVVTH